MVGATQLAILAVNFGPWEYFSLFILTLSIVARLAEHASPAIVNAQLYQELQRANQAKSEFVSFVSHELKTPMTSIRGFSDLLAAGVVGPGDVVLLSPGGTSYDAFKDFAERGDVFTRITNYEL